MIKFLCDVCEKKVLNEKELFKVVILCPPGEGSVKCGDIIGHNCTWNGDAEYIKNCCAECTVKIGKSQWDAIRKINEYCDK